MNLKTYKFSLIRYIPNPDRGEGLNVGVIISDDENLVVEWDINFQPSKDFATEWNLDEMLEWHQYYEKEFDIKTGTPKCPIDKLEESFWEIVRKKVRGPYILCNTRLFLSNEVIIENAAQNLLHDLVLRNPKSS